MRVAVPEISVHEARSLLEGPNPPRFIDVREEDEWALCRLPGATLMPLSAWPASAAERFSDPDEPLIIYCHHGGRSARAVEFLARNGFTRVANLIGGIDAWAMEIDPEVPRY